MSMIDIYLAIIAMTIANFLTRVFPFIFFRKNEPSPTIKFIAKFFPAVIMTILIFYTLSSIDFTQAPYGLKEIAAILVTAFLHIRFNNYLVSIIVGTLFYMLLVQQVII